MVYYFTFNKFTVIRIVEIFSASYFTSSWKLYTQACRHCGAFCFSVGPIKTAKKSIPKNLLAGDIDAMAARSKYFATRISDLLPHQSALPVCVVAATGTPKCLTVFRTWLVRAPHAA